MSLIYTDKHPKIIQANDLNENLKVQLKDILDENIQQKAFELSNLNRQILFNYDDIGKRKVNIASIAEVLNLPRETVRRKVLHLQKLKLLDYNKSGINIGPEYKTVFNEFVSGTVNNMSRLIKRWESDGSLKNLLELK